MSCIIWNKRCKRCHGNLALESDEYGTYLSCLQCGAVEIDTTQVVAARPGTPVMDENEEETATPKMKVA